MHGALTPTLPARGHFLTVWGRAWLWPPHHSGVCRRKHGGGSLATPLPRDGLFSVTQPCSMFAPAANSSPVPALTSSASDQSGQLAGVTVPAPETLPLVPHSGRAAYLRTASPSPGFLLPPRLACGGSVSSPSLNTKPRDAHASSGWLHFQINVSQSEKTFPDR